MAQAGTVEVGVDVDLSKVHDAIRQVEILRIRPDDVILLALDDDQVSEEEADVIRRQFVTVTGLENKVLVLCGIEVKILRPDEPGE